MRGLCTALLLLSPLVASAQTATEGPQKEFFLYPTAVTPFECLKTEAGMPNLEVSSITQDASGYLWFGTEDGLGKYDGYTIKTFRSDPDPSRSLINPAVRALGADENDHVWVGTEGGLDLYDNKTGKFEHFRADAKNPSALSGDSIIALDVVKGGVVWIATDAGINRFDPATKTFSRPVPKGPEDEVLSLQVDRNGHLWIGTAAGVTDFDPTTSKLRRLTDVGTNIIAIQEDKDGALWVASASEGVRKLDPVSGKSEPFRSTADPTSLSSDEVLAVLPTRNGPVWVGTNGAGLSRLDPATKKAERFPANADKPLGLPRSRVLSIFQDRSDIIWFGTFGGGVCKLDPLRNNFPLYLTRPGISSIVEDGDGILWLGSMVGLHRYNRVTGEERVFRNDPENPESIGGDTVWTSMLAKDGSLWLGLMNYGIDRFDPRTQKFTHYPADPENPTALKSDIVFSILEDSRGSLWLGTWGAGLALLDRATNGFTYFDAGTAADRSTIVSDFVYVIVEDKKQPGLLWIGNRGGLSRFDTNSKTFTQYTTPPASAVGVASFDVLSIFEAPDGQLWIGTHSHGLLRFDPKTGKFEATKAGPTSPIYGILDDPSGHLWLTTTVGLFRVDPKTDTAVRFDTTDGLQGVEHTQNGFFKSKKTGEMMVTGPNGMNIFNPEKVALDASSPPLALTSFKILGKDVDVADRKRSDGKVELSYFDRMFSVDFAALGYGAPAKQQYMYRLKGLHDDWIAAPTRTVSYSNLGGGDYALEIKAANRHGAWTNPLVFPIHVNPPPWRTWWAYTIYGLLVLAIAAGVWRAQRKRLADLEKANRLQLAEKDLDLMSAVQLWFLPRTDRLTEEHVRFKSFYRSAERASGDWWWFEHMPDGSLWILVGDVTGHGAGPAVVTAAVATACRIQRSMPYPMSIPERLEHLSHHIHEVCEGRYFVALTTVVIPPDGSSIQTVNAGGPAPMIMRADGKVEQLQAPPSTPLGDETLSLAELSRPLAPGDRVVIMTDGIIEVEGPDGAQLGMRRLRALLGELKQYDLDTAAEQLVTKIDTFRGKGNQLDDMTFVMLEV